jgi:HEAT repeat protein
MLLLTIAAGALETWGLGLKERYMGSENDLLSAEPRTRDAAVDRILGDRGLVIQRLIPLIDPANANKYGDGTRCAAAYLLGEFRAVEAIPVLAKALAKEPGRHTAWEGFFSRYDAPVFTALVNIGRPVVPAMIENIEKSDHDWLRKKSMLVVSHVLGGKRRLLELLTKLEERQAKQVAPNQDVLRRIREGRRWIEDSKEGAEPLY